MKRNKEIVYQYLQSNQENFEAGFTTADLVEPLAMQRTNLSTILNQLVSEHRLTKKTGRPVLYFINHKGQSEKDNSSFRHVIGSKKGSLENVSNLAKAAILYPEKSLSTLITGEEGTGKAFLAKSMFHFAKEKSLIKDEGQFVKIDCKNLRLQGDSFASIIPQLSDVASIYNVDGGLLFLKHIDHLDLADQSQLFSLLSQHNRDYYIVCSISSTVTDALKQYLYSKFPIKLELPSLSERPLKERLDFIQSFFLVEASRMKREIHINSEVLRCLLLYQCEENIDQLKRDIQIACASAFMREMNRSKPIISVYLSDFSTDIRKGFLFYAKWRQEIEAIIPDHYAYMFSKDNSFSRKLITAKNHSSIYEAIEKRAFQLQNEGLDEQSVATIITESLEENLARLTNTIEPESFDKTSLSKVVPEWLIGAVEELLLQLGQELGTIYSVSTKHALCLHLAAILERTTSPQISCDKKKTIKEAYKKEFEVVTEFLAELDLLGATHSIEDEAYLLTMILTHEAKNEKRVSVLIAMHGLGVATSIAKVVNTLSAGNQAYAYDLALDKDLKIAYDELSLTIQQIDQGRGVLLLYDMGSIKTMAQTISKETGVAIRFIEMPATLLALEATRHADGHVSLDEMYQQLKTDFKEKDSHYPETSHVEKGKRVILTLCMTGEGAALAMKHYIEKNASLDNTEVIAYAMSDRRELLAKVKQIKKTNELVCIIGSYDPQFIGVPFVSIAKLYNTPIDQLEVAMYLENQIDTGNSVFDAIYDYLKEQQPNLDIVSLKKYLPKAIRKIKRLDGQLAVEQEVGLFVHTACLISRLQMDGEVPKNANRDKIIMSHKRLYYQLKDIFLPIEEEFMIEFPDDEYANMISIIKEI
ncbi:PRD domain-containing protein [Streptococcus ovuberis]|uniref:PRD domain-containing protein n=1 Tax=Streptococcus ovuberis TaxID=1936207 RepID=A0A7X6S0Y6_9STRE|nr:PRD domain-containing protein [Streptococcus ovuberis]NKZ19805.1 PRD domain-containing protein [Streptococcus ovuberis]